MTFEERLRATVTAERMGVDVPDLQPLRDAARRRRRRHRLMACGVGLALAALAAGALLYQRADLDDQRVITAPVDDESTTGPAPAPNVQTPLPEPSGAGELRSWLAARTGVTDRQLILSFYPRGPGDCAIVTSVEAISLPDRVELALFLADHDSGLGGTCDLVGPPHVSIELPEPLAGRALYDATEPGVERDVIDGSTLKVPTELPDGMILVEERILEQPAWAQTYGATGVALVIIQSATHGRALAGAGLDLASPGDFFATLEGTKPIRSDVVRQVLGDDTIEMTVTVYRELPDGRVTDAAIVWRLHDVSYALRYGGTTGLFVDDLVGVAMGMEDA